MIWYKILIKINIHKKLIQHYSIFKILQLLHALNIFNVIYIHIYQNFQFWLNLLCVKIEIFDIYGCNKFSNYIVLVFFSMLKLRL